VNPLREALEDVRTGRGRPHVVPVERRPGTTIDPIEPEYKDEHSRKLCSELNELISQREELEKAGGDSTELLKDI
jgi:hypothetical protein